MKRIRHVAFALSLPLLAACGGSSKPALGSLDAANRVRNSPAAKEAERTAPQAIAIADQERKLAEEALSAGDEATANLHADRSLVAVEHAIVLARLARAGEIERDARARAERASGELRELTASRTKLDAENAELEKKIKIARELAQPPVSGPAEPKREAARKVAAESLLAQARLLCGAARLVAKGQANPEIDEAEKALAAKAPAAGGAAIDAAARARAACLGALTRYRRVNPVSGAAPGTTGSSTSVHADALLADLAGTGKFDAVRDERGVVVTMRESFDGARLSSDGEKSIAELGRVLKQNASYRAQVVVHEAARRDDGEVRAKAAASALAKAAGINESDVGAENAATRLPIVDPADAKLRPRNARLDVVFISPTN